MGGSPFFICVNIYRMGIKRTQLNEVIEPIVTAMGYEFIGCEFFPQGKHSLLRIYIDKKDGVDVDDCAKVSRSVSDTLDVEEPIKGEYTLEVSSPGLERPLFTIAHYHQFIGAKVHIRLIIPQEKRRNFTGVLVEVKDEDIVLNVDEVMFTFAFKQIEKANLVATL